MRQFAVSAKKPAPESLVVFVLSFGSPGSPLPYSIGFQTFSLSMKCSMLTRQSPLFPQLPLIKKQSSMSCFLLGTFRQMIWRSLLSFSPICLSELLYSFLLLKVIPCVTSNDFRPPVLIRKIGDQFVPEGKHLFHSKL